VDQFSLQRSHSPDPVVAGDLAGGRDRAVTADPTHSTQIGQQPRFLVMFHVEPTVQKRIGQAEAAGTLAGSG
jgi:hypothetical protein